MYAPFNHVVPGVAPTVQRTPTVAGARACGAEHDHDSGVDCVQIAAAVHDTVNADGNGGAVPPTHSASGALPSFPCNVPAALPRVGPAG